MIRFKSSLLVLSLLFLSPQALAGFSGELVPSYSAHYDDLTLLSIKGAVPSGLLNMRPLTRGQIAAVLAAGLRVDRTRLLADPVGQRLIREFSREIESLGVQTPVQKHQPFWSISLASADDGLGSSSDPGPDTGSGGSKPSSYSGGAVLELSPYAWVRVDNVEPIYFESLEDRRVGVEGTLSAGEGHVLIHADLVVGNHSYEPRGIPEFGTQNALIEGEDINSWLHRGYLRAGTKVVDAFYGRDWVRWGPGRTGVLGVGDAASALNLFSLRKRMGDVDLATYVAILDFASEQMVAGHRAEFRVTPTLTIGLAEQARFETIQQAPLYLLAFYPYSLMEKLVGTDSEFSESPWRNNVMWTADFDWLPVALTRLYGEFLLDDLSFSADKKPTQIGYQVGFARSRLLGVETLSIQAEFTKIQRFTYTQARRSAADSSDSVGELDFAHHNRSLGHSLGPDSEGYYLGLRYDASVRSRWDFSWELRRSGELGLGDGWRYGSHVPDTFPLSGIVEASTRIMAHYTFYPERWSGSWLGLGGGFRKISNVENRDGVDVNWDGIMRASVAVQW